MGEPETVFYAACLTMALQHLHSRGIAYPDLKSENVLLSGELAHELAHERAVTCRDLRRCLRWKASDGRQSLKFAFTLISPCDRPQIDLP